MVVLGLWFLFQFISGSGSFLGEEQLGGVAYGAHIGGFLAGMFFGMISRLGMDHEPDNVFTRVTRLNQPAHPAYRPNRHVTPRRR